MRFGLKKNLNLEKETGFFIPQFPQNPLFVWGLVTICFAGSKKTINWGPVKNLVPPTKAYSLTWKRVFPFCPPGTHLSPPIFSQKLKKNGKKNEHALLKKFGFCNLNQSKPS